MTGRGRLELLLRALIGPFGKSLLQFFFRADRIDFNAAFTDIFFWSGRRYWRRGRRWLVLLSCDSRWRLGRGLLGNRRFHGDKLNLDRLAIFTTVVQFLRGIQAGNLALLPDRRRDPVQVRPISALPLGAQSGFYSFHGLVFSVFPITCSAGACNFLLNL